MDFTLPIIDFSSYRGGDAVSRKEMIHEIYQATQDAGFFYLKNFGIAPEHIADAFQHSRTFFALPAERKSEIMWDRSNRGYDGIEAQAFDPSKPGDLKESFRFGAEPNPRNEPEAGVPWAFMANQPNKWPSGMPEFRAHLLSFFSECGDLVEDVLGALEEALELPEASYRRSHMRRNYNMRLIHYPAVTGPVKDGQARCGEHTDWGTITLLFQGGQGGLEVRKSTGEWIPAPPIADCVLVNIADELQAWTKGKLVSTPHRVRADSIDSTKDRYSIVLFAYADYDAKIEIGGTHTSGEYVLSKLAATQDKGSVAVGRNK
jgi:isopenicillin N synthase-like dioxygenase